MLRRVIGEKKVVQFLLCTGVLLPVSMHAQNAKQASTPSQQNQMQQQASQPQKQVQTTQPQKQAQAQTTQPQQQSASQQQMPSDMNAMPMGQNAPEAKKWTKEELYSQDFIQKLSLTHGQLIQKSLNNPVLQLDMTAVIQGMQDGKDGIPSPLTEQEYEEALGQIQEYAFQDMSEKNLQQANAFLKDNQKKKGIVELEQGKVQYMVLQQGSGAPVTDDTIPSVKYKGSYIDGTVFGTSENGSGPVSIPLDQTIPGFRKGVMGMKVGEKRRIFIHPDLGYGVYGQLLPNSLLIFEIEVVDVKPKPQDKKDANKLTSDADDDDYDDDEDISDDDDDEDDNDDK